VVITDNVSSFVVFGNGPTMFAYFQSAGTLPRAMDLMHKKAVEAEKYLTFVHQKNSKNAIG
jgi:hypothetical protein